MAAEHGFYAAFPRLLLDGNNDRRSRAGFDIQQIRQATVADSSAEFAVCGIGEISQTALFFWFGWWPVEERPAQWRHGRRTARFAR